jgi:hypothetical protein
MNKAALESYARNLLGQVIAAVMVVMQAKGLATPLDFGSGEWLLVANALWGSLIPVALRWANKKDPAFGRIATLVAAEAGKKLASSVTVIPAKKAAAKKAPAKKAVTKK